MYFRLYFLLIATTLVKTTPTQKETPFLKYSLEGLKNNQKQYCRNPDFFIEMANIEESKPANQDKIILYHGESYGTWIYQMIMKAFLYPEAPEGWLPLRIEKLETDIDKTNLLRLITYDNHDHMPEYTKIGISVTPNLYSNSIYESAWGKVCNTAEAWHKITGSSDYKNSKHHELYGALKDKFIPEELWGKFKYQKKLLNFFIREKRKLFLTKIITEYFEKVKTFFPKTFRRYFSDFRFLFADQHWKKELDFNFEGVVLQIIMEKQLANQITYNSHPFGWVKDNAKYSKYNQENHDDGQAWEGDDIQPYNVFYEQVKNQKDDEQARVALNNDFRRYPSRVRIKAIAGIMKNPIDYEVVQSMIKEMAELSPLNAKQMEYLGIEINSGDEVKESNDMEETQEAEKEEKRTEEKTKELKETEKKGKSSKIKKFKKLLKSFF